MRTEKRVKVSRKKLSNAMKLKGFRTQQSLAQNVGVSQRTICRALQEEPIAYATFKLICLSLGLDEEDLILDSPESEENQDVDGSANLLKEQNKMLSEMLNIMRETQKTINLVKLDVATMRFGSEKDRETLGYIHKNVGEVAKIWSESNGNS